jgi:putative oxidoreductase
MSIAILIARLFLGLGMAAHGTQKLLGWFGGYGLTTTGEFFVQLGWKQGRIFATAASLGEIASGILVALGLFGPVGPALMILVMLVASVTVHRKNGFFATKNGVELPLLYATGVFLLAFMGPGAISLDHLLGLDWLSTPGNAWIALAIAAAAATINIIVRHPSQSPLAR